MRATKVKIAIKIVYGQQMQTYIIRRYKYQNPLYASTLQPHVLHTLPISLSIGHPNDFGCAVQIINSRSADRFI